MMQFSVQHSPANPAAKLSVHFVVSCSHRKRQQIPDDLYLREHLSTSPPARLSSWVTSLQANSVQPTRAADLYGGEHWHIALDLPAQAEKSGLWADLWVLSAGYGLVSAEQRIKPYSATFTPGHADSVTRPGDGPVPDQLHSWWEGLATANPLGTSHPNIASLVANDPTSSIVVATSRHYLEACEKDLLKAAASLANQDQLIILSMSLPRSSPLREYAIPIDARLEHVVGGTRSALNTRAATKALALTEGNTPLRSIIAPRMERLLNSQPSPRQYDRRPIDDAEVKEWIAKQLQSQPTAARTRLLGQLRSSGMACEQKRFGQLYRQVRKTS